MRRQLLAFVLGLLTATTGQAAVKLPKVFGDSMVLQRNSDVAVWGWADKGEAVKITLAGATAEVKAGEDGKWLAKIKTGDAGGPHEMTIAGSNTITIKDVLVGEVWLCSGQSNMEWPVAASLNPQEEAAAANYPQIRMIKVKNTAAESPQEDIQGEWKICTPANTPSFSAVGYYFARHLNKELKVPVGIINSSWGGTICEAWASKPALEANPDFAPMLERSKTFEPGKPNQASVLFNGMINPIVPYGIRGALWYQGESNRSRAAQYRTLFPAMIADWRKQFGQGDFPFGFVQLAPYKYVGNNNPDDPGKLELAEIWESQTAALKHPNIGMAVTTDISNLTDIHPKNKQDVGLRLGLWALGTVYKTLGEDTTAFTSPLYASHQVEGSSIRVKFAHANGGLVAKDGKPLTFFQICGEDKKFVAAEAKIEGDSVIVSAAAVEKPVAVRFAWHELAEPNLFNKTGLPASPFRTDDFLLITAGRK